MARWVNMSPAKRAKSKGKPARKAARPAKSSKAAKSSKGKTKAAKPKGAAKPMAAAAGSTHAHCAATDPFGGPCQNVPRRPSKYCVIHSYLDR
jgi:hypothetical protein